MTQGGVWATCIVRPEEKGKGKKATKKRVTRQLHARFRVLVLQALTYLRIYILWIDEELFLLKKKGVDERELKGVTDWGKSDSQTLNFPGVGL